MAVAESMNMRRVFSLDRDFHTYRLKGRRTMEVIP